ncbi:MAG: transposase [Patescibacteria group bacterium]
MRKTKFAPGEYYHIYNRGNNKQDIFLDTRDWVRFLFITLYFQSSITMHNISQSVTHYIKHSVFNVTQETTEEIITKQFVGLVAFSLMPNHFHILIQEIKTSGLSQYMQRIQNSYTKYFNTKYKKTGHLLQGPFQAVHIKSNNQLLHLSAYIHRNAREIPYWKGKEGGFPWSSYQDYIMTNRWSKLLENKVIMDQFINPNDYKKFTDKSSTKILKKEYLFEE